MTGLPASFAVEFWFGGAWVDVTAYHVGEGDTSIHQGRQTEYGDIGAGTLSFQLRNEDGRFTPRSATSPYYPEVVPGVQVRVRVTHSATTYSVFTGKVTAWEPSWPNRGVAGGVVTVTAVDALAELASTTLDDRWTEEARALARAASTWVDVPVLAGSDTATGLDNVGLTSTTLGTATVVPAGTAVGKVSFGTPTGLILARQVTFDPVDAIGPSVQLAVQAAPVRVDFWVSVPADVPIVDACVAAFLDSGGTILGSLWGTAGAFLSLELRNGAGTPVANLVTNVADGVWRHLSLVDAGTSTTVVCTATDGTTATLTGSWDLGSVATVVWGAKPDGTSALKGSISGPVAFGASVAMVTARGLPGQTALLSATYAALQSYVPTVTSWATDGSEDRTIGEPAWYGKTAMAVLQQLARTVNGIGWCRGDGAVTIITGDVARPATAVATLDVEEDLDARSEVPTFRDDAGTQPTRVTITYATGTVTAVSDAEAAGRPRVEVQVDTCAADQASALFAGDYVLTASDALRVSKVAVNLYDSLQDLWAPFCGLFPTQMFTLDGWPAAMAGETSIDVHVQGWELRLSEQRWTYTLDCSPAGLFASGTWDGGDSYGRWAFEGGTVTGGTAVGSLSNGTMVVAFTGGVGLTLDVSQYPLYLDWDGEKVEISAPPAGTSSPQTVTTTARGVAPTAAQLHVAGEAVDIYKAAVFGF